MKPQYFFSLLLFCLTGALSGSAHAEPFSQVAVGLSHLCGLSVDGSVDCRTQAHSTRYDSPDDLVALTAISAGHQHTCGITLEGEAVCWGGINYYNEQDVPQIDQPLVDIAAGVSHTCAIDTNSRAWCWGLDTNGQTQVPNNGLGEDGSGFIELSANGNATCGVQVTGNISCWSTDTQISNTSSLTGSFIDLDISGDTACGLKDTGDIQCWALGAVIESGFTPPNNGPYSELVVSNAAVCGIDQDQQLDCASTVYRDSFITDTRFISMESGKLPFANNSNFCGVTIDGAIECLASVALPEVPGNAVNQEGSGEGIASIELALSARIYDRNAVELFWPSLFTFQQSLVEVYRDDVLVVTTDAQFSYFDPSVKPDPAVTYKIRPIDAFGNVGQFSNEVMLNLETGIVVDDNVISAGSIVSSEFDVGDILIESLATEIIISWQGSTPGVDGLKGYEVRVNNEVVVTTRNLSYASSRFVDGACNIVSVAAISDDNTILDYRTRIFSRTRNSFGSGC